jgi:hypothetical protein
MNEIKIFVMLVGIAAVAVLGYFALQRNTIQNDFPKEEIRTETIESELEENDEIQSKIEEKYAELEKQITDKGEYKPAPRDWPTSGPFEIDRSRYVLGENVFVRVHDLQPQEKGQIAFLRPLNETHYSVYKTIHFDGSNKLTFNQYFKPDLSRILGTCTKNDLLGDWAVVFQGTNHTNLHFEIVDQIVPGTEENYQQKVC